MFEYVEDMVYTAVTADQLQAGDIVALADNIKQLKKEPTIGTLMRIAESDSVFRFVDSNGCGYTLAQLIARKDDIYKDFKKAFAEGRTVYEKLGDKWFEKTISTFNRDVCNYSLEKPTSTFNRDVWNYSLEKPTEELKLGMIVRAHSTGVTGYITAIKDDGYYSVGGMWYEATELEVVDDFSSNRNRFGGDR